MCCISLSGITKLLVSAVFKTIKRCLHATLAKAWKTVWVVRSPYIPLVCVYKLQFVWRKHLPKNNFKNVSLKTYMYDFWSMWSENIWLMPFYLTENIDGNMNISMHHPWSMLLRVWHLHATFRWCVFRIRFSYTIFIIFTSTWRGWIKFPIHKQGIFLVGY